MDLDMHLQRLAQLLDLERDEERERFAAAQQQLSLAEREARGLLISEVEAVEEGALAGRPLVTYGRNAGGPIGGARIGVGSLIRVTLRREPRGESLDAPSGVVARRRQDSVAVVFDEPPPDWATAGRVLLELLPSSVTYERLKGAVRRIQEERGAGARWRGVLSGEAPRFAPAEAAAGLPESLNAEQQQAVLLAERALDVALVHGPPGTGKTTVLVEIVRRAVARGETVLACAPSNLAVDNLVERLSALGLDTVRIGHPARVLPSVLERTLEVRVKNHDSARIAAGLVDEALSLRRQARKWRGRRGPERFAEARAGEQQARALLAEARKLEAVAEADVLSRARVVLATLTGVETEVLSRRRFPLAVVDEATQAVEPAAYLALLRADRVVLACAPSNLAVVDEATQAVEPAAYLALLRADRVVLAGDHLQLPPTILSAGAQAGGLGVSLFERFVALHGDAIKITLAEQHRMNEVIMRYPSQALYDGRLRAHPAVAHHALDDAPLLFIDTCGRGFEEEVPAGSDSRCNPGEAELAVAEVERILELGVAPTDVALISPYDAQVQLLRGLLPAQVAAGLEVDTVDGFQGREKEAVVVSLVRSNDLGEVGFLSDVRRMNVAITRARKKLVVIGDGATIAYHPFYEGFIRYAQQADAWSSAWER